jgi:hypothetical protein
MIAVATRLLWRTAVPAVGLAAAFAVGWRLSPAITVLVVVCAWLPLGMWCLFAPPIRAAFPVALALLGAIGTIRWTLPGGPGDRTLDIAWSTLMWYSLPGALALLVAIWRPRWLWSRATADTTGQPARRRWLRATATLTAAGALVVGCCCGGLDVVLGVDEVPVPSSAELFPLPTGMHATTAKGPNGDNGCDNAAHACWTYYRITGQPGESAADLTERIRRHLREAKGWDGQPPCRPVHWFAQRIPTDFCINVTTDPASTVDHPTIGVELVMSDLGPLAMNRRQPAVIENPLHASHQLRRAHTSPPDST